ncbi:DNA polymerase delta subunit 2-like protein [Dinothrombium tinctorium]|uniref:DNA polymerase delta subunit 2-like protein n=1 Tax=Dinothrombium tinctorium TaxID=1965070 RepID=A0A3S3P7U7_9ACAR|nr:DNA polymerase delta subunit 2-like protein [Dinothrombium tinctorium]
MEADVLELERSSVLFEDKCERFAVREQVYTSQYYPYYNARLKIMYPWIKESAELKWGADVRIIKLIDLTPNSGEKVCIIGTLFKKTTLQPTILKELSEEHQLIPQPAMEKYISAEDVVFLQDERETVQLIGNFDVHSVTTGITIAILGYEEDDGNKFLVEDYCFASFNETVERPLSNEEKYVAIISDLGFSTKSSINLLSARNMFVDFVTGSGVGKQNIEKAAKVVKVIIAGNCISKDVKSQEQEEQKKTVSWSKKTKSHTLEVLKVIDDFLVQIGKSIDVDVMPGDNDATSVMLPQQPLHPCLLPKASVLSSIRCVTNPYSASFDSTVFLGTSGQNVDSIRQYTNLDEPVDILERTLLWRHLVPSAPDTLASYPFSDKDPFVITECPHVYFAGNQKSFNTKLIELQNGQVVRLVAVPQFESSFNCVLINLENLQCELVAFG